MVLRKLDSTYKRMNVDPYLIPYAKVNSKCIEDLNTESKTIKFLKHRGKVMLLDS